MKNLKNAALVGLLVTAAVVAFYVSFMFLSEEYSERDTYRLHAYFNDASGLYAASRVNMAGIQVGHVSDIRLEKGKARVEVAILKKYDIFDNATISKRTASIMGDAVLGITPGTKDYKKLEEGDRIKRVIEQGGLDEIQRTVGDITEDLKQVTETANKVFGSPESAEKLEQILTNLHDITESLDRTLETNTELVNKTVENVEGISSDARPQIREILENVKIVTEDIRKLVDQQEGEVGETVSDLKGSLKTLNSAIEKLDRTMTNVEKASDDIAQEKGTVGKLISDEEIAEDVAETVEGAAGLVGSVKNLQTIVGLRSEYNFFANSLKTYVSIMIQPKEDKYYLIEVVDDPRGKRTVEVTNITSTHPDDPHYWHETRETTTHKFKFSFMFARRISFATFRFGIKESTGGLGLDLHFFKDSLSVETDLYDFASNVFPRLKVAAALRFLRKIYIVGGIDDVLNKERDYFIGAQLRFNDEDLKAVLLFAPVGAATQ
jgi:phospholipid/cholesterol/gamma-HCH transport system substrate-binding protein